MGSPGALTRARRMGGNIVVIGCQWGDEGKGKIVDVLTERVQAVVRFQGGHNRSSRRAGDNRSPARKARRAALSS